MKTTRREFLRSTATAASLAALAAGIRTRAYAAGGDTIRLGLIGCGGRGTGAAAQALNACKRAQLVAVGDAFEDQLGRCVKAVAKEHPDRVDVPPGRRFAGMDNYQGVIDAGVDMVLLCTPPGFRPLHFEVAVGLNNRHQDGVRRIIQRVHDGAIGDVMFLRAYGNNAGVWVRPRQPGQSEMEYQMRNWYYFNWLCGDLIVEQTVHSIDLAKWDDAMKSKIDLGPKRYAWDAEAPITPGPDQMYACATPGKTKPY